MDLRALQKISLLLLCLACVGLNRRIQSSVEQPQSIPPAGSLKVTDRGAFNPLRAFVELLAETVDPAAAFNPVGSGAHSPEVVSVRNRVGTSVMQDKTAFSLPKSTDEAAAEQAERAAAAGMTPQEYEEATRQAAFAHLQSVGAHTGGDGAGAPQTAGFLKQLWNVDSIPALPEEVADDPSHVLATVYEIGGPLTGILSTSVAKKLPLIPHVGIRVHGVEYFYSDHIEYRTVPVMKEMLGERPQVTLDLGKTSLSPEEVQKVVDSLESDWTADDYHVFDKNCVHFADVLGKKVTEDRGVPRTLLQGVIDVSERMLDSLPEWRRLLGRRVMNEVTRLVVVSWGRASKEKKEQAADKLGLDRGE